MSLDSRIKSNWIEAQKNSDRPVNALGLPIDPKDERTLAVWRQEGIDRYLGGGRDDAGDPS
ncbi:MAG: hypothetical protein PVG07_05040 [Acidobacteriota bacterium]|jgi:hypothetical protein